MEEHLSRHQRGARFPVRSRFLQFYHSSWVAALFSPAQPVVTSFVSRRATVKAQDNCSPADREAIRAHIEKVFRRSRRFFMPMSISFARWTHKCLIAVLVNLTDNAFRGIKSGAVSCATSRAYYLVLGEAS